MLVWVHQYFFLTKCFRCILFNILLVIITTLFLLFTVHFYDEDLGMLAFLSLLVDSINIKRSFFSKFSNRCCAIPHVCMFFLFIIFIHISDIVVLSGDIEKNPGSDPGYSNSFPFCHWNLNSIAAHGFIKMSLLQADNPYNIKRGGVFIYYRQTYL